MNLCEKETPSISNNFFACLTDVAQALNRNNFGTEALCFLREMIAKSPMGNDHSVLFKN